MSRLTFTIAMVGLLLPGVSALAESWDCGASTGYSTNLTINTDTSACGSGTVTSGSLVINTDTSPCGSDTATFGPLAIETDLSQCGVGTDAIDQVMIIDTIWSPGTIKKHPLGERVTLPVVPVTRAFSDRFYIESLDRTPGIGVMQQITADPGKLATVTGTIGSFEGEIVLLSPDVTLGDLGDAPKPLGMASPALVLGVGADPSGLLATVWGKASVPDGKTYYLVSDGGVPFTVLPEGVPRPVEGERVILTGIPGLAVIDGEHLRVFRVNGQ